MLIGSIIGILIQKEQQKYRANSFPVKNKQVSNNEDTEKFTGIITDLKLNSMDDGQDWLIINKEKNILVNPGFVDSTFYVENPKGKILNTDKNYLPEIGQKIEAFVKKTDKNTYSLFGSKDYYIKVLNNEPHKEKK